MFKRELLTRHQRTKTSYTLHLWLRGLSRQHQQSSQTYLIHANGVYKLLYLLVEHLRATERQRDV